MDLSEGFFGALSGLKNNGGIYEKYNRDMRIFHFFGSAKAEII